MARVLVVGGYGNAGALITSGLLDSTAAEVVVAGRRAAQAEACAATMPPAQATRLTLQQLDATDRAAVESALAGVDLVVVAAGGTRVCLTCADAAIATGTDYLDIQFNYAKERELERRSEQFRAAGVVAVTEGGFHPGVPGAMIRHIATSLPVLQRAWVASVIDVDWASLQTLASSTVAEVLDQFTDFRMCELTDGSWRKRGRSRQVDFPPPFGRRRVAPMDLAELHDVARDLPGLQDAGFYVGGFGPLVDYLVLPSIWMALKVAPHRARRRAGQLLVASLIRTSKPPFGTVLQLDGGAPGQPDRTLMRISHPDAYVMTAAPAVAAVRQMLQRSDRVPGLHRQATYVDTAQFFADLAVAGISVEVPDVPRFRSAT